MPDIYTPTWNDSISDSWQKVARNFYAIALDKGFAGISPNAVDNEIESQKKAIIYTAYIAENP